MRGAVAGVGLLILASCTAPAVAPPISSPIVAEQSDQRPKLWYLGLGLFGESWSQNDVADVPDELMHGATGFRVVPVVLHESTEPSVIETTIADIAAAASPGDVIMIGTADLQRWLTPLRGHDTVLLLSACFSGSFIPALQEPHRIVFTAARADRTSFGCQAGAEHTVFGDALLQTLAQPGTSLRDAVAATRATVTARERALRVTDPSQPQVSVGAAVTRLYDAPVF